MKRYILTMLLAIAAVFAHADNSLWKAYMAYHDITRIEQSGKRLYRAISSPTIPPTARCAPLTSATD